MQVSWAMRHWGGVRLVHGRRHTHARFVNTEKKGEALSSTCVTCQVLQGRPLVVHEPSAQYSREGQSTSPSASGKARRARMKAAQKLEWEAALKVSAGHMAEARGVHLKDATRAQNPRLTSAVLMVEARGVDSKAATRAQYPRRTSAVLMAEARGVHLKAATRAQYPRRTSALLMAAGRDVSTRIMLCLQSSQCYLMLASVLMGFNSAISTTTWTHRTRARRSEGRSCSLGQC